MTQPHRETPPHWLRPNPTTHVPAYVLCFDTEARRSKQPGGERHDLELGCWTFDLRHPDRTRQSRTEEGSFDSPAELADVLENHSRSKRTLWVYALNLDYDLSLSLILETMAGRGWELHVPAPGDKLRWAKLRRGHRRIIFADLHTWVPTSLRRIGELVGIPKGSLPADTDPREAWLAYCRVDVAILRRAIIGLMDWWEADDMGRWGVTGPASWFNAFRHRYLSDRILIDHDPDRRALERAALMGGRRENYIYGELPPYDDPEALADPEEAKAHPGRFPKHPYSHLDLHMAYAHVAGSIDVPTKPRGWVVQPGLDGYLKTRHILGWIAEVVIDVGEHTCLPVRFGDHLTFPMGKIRTTLCGPELDLAIDHGHPILWLRAFVYTKAPVFERWADAIIALADRGNPDTPPLVAEAAKHAGRTVIGRFALRYRSMEELGPSPMPGAGTMVGVDMDTGARTDYAWWQGTLYKTAPEADGAETFPAITAFVHSAHRAMFYNILKDLEGPGLLACDTDGVIIDPAAYQSDPASWPVPHPAPWRLKALYHDVAILGPQQIWTLEGAKVAGLAKHSWETPNGYRVSESWLGWWSNRAHRDAPPMTVRTQEWAPGTPAFPRWLTTNGRTLPIRLELRSGRPELVAWDRTQWPDLGYDIPDGEEDRLAAYLRGPPPV